MDERDQIKIILFFPELLRAGGFYRSGYGSLERLPPLQIKHIALCPHWVAHNLLDIHSVCHGHSSKRTNIARIHCNVVATRGDP